MAIEAAPDLTPEARGKTVWRWREDPAGNATAAEAQKRRISAAVSVDILASGCISLAEVGSS